ncbi:zf-TFIIB domain-containing protein [Rubellimicrobium arenae]|uniref:TFIIB-type zinc ribbon-containing protein n=1 Tax=Rubellimicrobium arenae TaxID=2817372 RepID=UPI001B309A45|nr:zf-TFIIB domain-containing protein [Rubellimicrobium arenae]
MKCPVDGTTLMMTERSGVEIDYCPQCRGVWLDRGELDKILERAVPSVTLQEPAHDLRQGDDRPQRRDDFRTERHGHDSDDQYRKKRRKSLLNDIFDF